MSARWPVSPTRCYRIPYMHYHGQVISSNSPVSGAFRSWSAAEEALMMERQLDAAAEKLGMDRLAIRLKNVARSGEEDKKLHLSLEDIRIGDAITLGSEKFGWDKLKAEDAAFNASQQRYRRGRRASGSAVTATHTSRASMTTARAASA